MYRSVHDQNQKFTIKFVRISKHENLDTGRRNSPPMHYATRLNVVHFGKYFYIEGSGKSEKIIPKIRNYSYNSLLKNQPCTKKNRKQLFEGFKYINVFTTASAKEFFN